MKTVKALLSVKGICQPETIIILLQKMQCPSEFILCIYKLRT